MLTLVEVRTEEGGEPLALPLQDISSGYSIQNIIGLDPVKATLVSTSFANLDGEQYQSARRDKRNIVFTLGYEPDFVSTTVRKLRNNLYSYFMPKADVWLRFYMDDEDNEPPVDIQGKIESFDSPLFAKDPVVTISVLCFDPDFYVDGPVTITGNTVPDATETLVEYTGTVETGFLFTLSPTAPVSSFSIYNRTPDGNTRSLDFTSALAAGDILEISTVTGAKGAEITTGGNGSPILYGISPYSDWVKLYPGDNFIRIYADGVPQPFTIEYNTRYGGL